MKFELTQKMQSRTVITTSNEPWSLLTEMAAALSPKAGGVGGPDIAHAGGDIEISLAGGGSVRLRAVNPQK